MAVAISFDWGEPGGGAWRQSPWLRTPLATPRSHLTSDAIVRANRRSSRRPSAGQEDETDGSRDAPHDDQGQAEQEAGEQGRGTVVDAVGEHRLKPAVEWLDLLQQLPGTVGILDVGGMDDDAEQQARGVDRDVALAPLDLFTRVVAARPPFSVVLTL